MAARRRCQVAGLILLALAATAAPRRAAANRIDDIRARGHLTCGVLAGVAGFAERTAQGVWRGFDIDICRAIAAAILGDADAVRFVEVISASELDAMPEIDLAARRLTWTLTREASHGLMFGPIVFFDGQGFLVPGSGAITRAQDLNGKRICIDAGEDWARNLRHYARDRNLDVRLVISRDAHESGKRLLAGECDAYSADKSMLGAIRADLGHVKDYRILDDEISQEPLAPLLRQGDDSFFLVVRWTIFALVSAEEFGVTSANAESLRESPDPDIRRLLGGMPGNGKALGLGEEWAYRAIKAVGNYGEMFDRDLGASSAIQLDRGSNRLWTQGGLMYAPPLR
jgi:general L-amino acid transport system substrate-binding protein